MMRLYVHAVTNGVERPTYTFAPLIKQAREYTKALADCVCQDFLARGGPAVVGPYGRSVLCTDFRIEPHPDGGFAISCENPLFTK